MKKLTRCLLFLSILILISCERLVPTRNELIVYIDNALDKSFICFYETNFGEKESLINNQEIDSMVFINEQIIDISFLGKGNYDYEPTEIVMQNIKLYNITDTSNVEYSKLSNENINILFNHYSSDLEVHYGYNSTTRDTLTIDSTLLPIFKKDYNMLEQFSEYYKKEE